MKCKNCELVFSKVSELRTHYHLGHPGYMRRIGRQIHSSNVEVELAERAAWGIQPGIPINLGKSWAKRPLRDEEAYIPRKWVYCDPVENLVRRRELDSAA